jgi:hypothetical protein
MDNTYRLSEVSMNSSIYSADRATHLRIVAIALVISIAIVGLGIVARVSEIGAMEAGAYPAHIVKAGQLGREAASRMVPGHA